jgi:hypothetical protein
MRDNFTIAGRLFFFLFPLLLSGKARSQETSSKPLPRGVEKGWYSEAVAKIEDREYFIRALDPPGLYGAVNYAQHLGYWFNGDGYGVKSFNEVGSGKNVWQTRWMLTRMGRMGQLNRHAVPGSSRFSDHLLQFDYGKFVITYDNEKSGMEQRFILKRRLSGTKPLEIALDLSGDLEARIDSGNELLFFPAGHPQEVKLAYDQLNVWDKNGRRLPAHMTLNGRHVILTVDDRKAVYPVTVDPFTHASSQTFTAENILNSGVTDATDHVLFGYSVSGAGDVNGDGIDDIIIGAPTFAVISSISGTGGGTITLNTSVAVVGAAFIYFGVSGATPSTTPSGVFQPSGLAQGALFGYSVSTIGNAGGSTTNKGVAIGAPGDQASLTFGSGTSTVAVGRVYLYTNSSNFSGNVATATNPDLVLSLQPAELSAGGAAPPNHNPLFGFSVADAGDVNGDGYDDIIVGSPLSNDASAFGRIDIYQGSASGVVTTPATEIIGSIAGGYFGFSVSSAGNANGDVNSSTSIGLSDIIVGAPGGIEAGGVIQGMAYVFYGNAAGITATNSNAATGSIGTVLQAPGAVTTGTLFGFSVSTAGDVNDDGYGDVIVGEPLHLNGGGANGQAYVYYGSGNASGIGAPALPTTTLISPRAAAGANLLFGFSVGTAGTVAGNPASEVIVGEPGSVPASANVHTLLSGQGFSSNATTTAGQAYVFAGSASTGIGAAAAPVQTISDASTPNLLGTSVHLAGDVDGSGSDFLVGEPSGILDLGFNLTTLEANPGNTLEGTLTTAANKGLITINSTGQATLYYGSAVVLPISLLSFTGQAEGGGVLLHWATAQEQNSSYFEVDRSADNQNYTAIGQVSAADNSTQTTNYSFTDGSPLAGNNYYRLKMVDLDGSSVYSQVVVVNFGSSSQPSVDGYPNPAHGSFTLLFRNMTPGRYGVSLLNAIGQTMQTTMVQVTDPVSDNEPINIDPGLASGAYFVRIVDQQSRATIVRIIIQ